MDLLPGTYHYKFVVDGECLGSRGREFRVPT
jgi:hypothetical protein